MRVLALAAVTALSLVSAAATATPSDAGRLEFEVFRNGEPLGRHIISVSGSGDSLRARSELDLRASMGPVTVFRMEQTCTENWSEGMLSGLSCNTLRDGRRTRVRAHMRNGRLLVSGEEGEHWFPIGSFPTSWWTEPPTNASALIDTQTGAPIRVRVRNMGNETYMVGGQRIQAQRIQVQGAIIVDLWYDMAGRWVGCEFRTRGQNIEYRLASPINAAPS